MRVVIISDTHNRHGEIELPKGDVLVHCGDATGRGTFDEVRRFADWLEAQPFQYKVMIAGNHDFLFQKDPNLAKSLLAFRGIHYLMDDCATIEGVLFYGSPWQPWFYDWAFNLERGPEIAKKWAKIPDETEFLITHGPPKSILDQTRTGERVGCDDLWRRVLKVRPAVHAFGHIHEAYGVERLIPDITSTIFVNASICTLEYVPKNKPIVVAKYNHGWNYVPPSD